MKLLRTSLTAFALFSSAFACAPAVDTVASPASVTSAVFDPTNGKLPLPNDLLLSQDPNSLGLAPAEAELIGVFQAQGGFPNDQEVSVTIDFTQSNIDPTTGAVTQVAPDLDLASFVPYDPTGASGTAAPTYAVLGQTDTTLPGSGVIALDPIAATDYVKFATYGELTLHNKGHLPWAPGHYIVAIRGGTNGVKTASGALVVASSTFYLIEQEQDLTLPQNIGLLQAQLGSLAAAEAAAAQLNQLIAAYTPAFAAVDTIFPHTELAVIDTFTIAPAVTQVELDPNRGLVPLPIDLLRNPVAGGLITPVAACSLASGTLTASGACVLANGSPDGLAAGFATLDGFSTTGGILAPTSGLLNAATVTPHSATSAGTVQLYDLTNPAAPALVDPSTYITEPVEVQSEGFSPVIDIQPAGATAGDATSVFRTKPLKDATDYAVVISNGVLDSSGHPLGRGTVANILLFTNQLVSGTTSQLTGVADATAGALEVMRKQLEPVITAAAANGIPKANIAMAYTFHTQTILSTAAQLGALPYNPQFPAALTAALAAPGPISVLTPLQAFAKYGLEPGLVPGTADADHIAEVIDTSIVIPRLLDPASGAFFANPNDLVPTPIPVLISVPKPASLTACGAAFGPFAALGCAPMVIFRHGLGSGRAAMLTVADTLNAHGVIVVAIDAEKHGDRSFCAHDSDCLAGSTCVEDPAQTGQGDAAGASPGICTDAGGTTGTFARHPVLCPDNLDSCNNPPDGIPNASSNFLVSANFFRTRDTLREDIIDQSQLVHALAVAPVAPTADPTLYNHLAGEGILISPTEIYYLGQSLGSIQGTVDVASNPRITKAVLNVGGGTVVDIFANSPAFKTQTDQLLLSIGVVPGTASYLQFLTVAKTILDPADPINFAGHLTANELPDLLDMLPAQAPKKVLTQIAYCDQTVPNPFEYLLASNIPTGPLPGLPGFIPPNPGVSAGSTGTSEVFVKAATLFTDCPLLGGGPLPPAAVPHAFLTNWTSPEVDPAAYGLTAQAQADAAAFILSDTNPPSLQFP